MGGKNHQPCRRYIHNSTQMSKYSSKALAHLELANVELEDVILAEMSGQVTSFAPMQEHLSKSVDSLDEMHSWATKLFDQMSELGYEDLPTLKTMDHSAVGDQLISAGMVSESAWAQVVHNATTGGGFYANLAVIREQASLLMTRTNALITKVQEAAASGASFHDILEFNHAQNFKQEFFAVYEQWSQFQQLFIASSILSTEAYYMFNNYGSLVDQTAQRRVA